jgi:hypothetical protein
MPSPRMNTDADRLRVQFEAWMRGARSRAMGFKLHENPFEERTLAGDAWENGWECINHDLRTSERIGIEDNESI